MMQYLKSEIRISKKLNDELANDVYQTLTFAENKDLEQDENKEQLLNNLDTIILQEQEIFRKKIVLLPTDENYHIALKRNDFRI